MRTLPNVLLIMSLSSLGGCGFYPFLYHAPVQQGNIIAPDAVAQLHPGMNKAAVIDLMGEPVLQTPFTANSWSYVYVMRKHNKVVQEQHVTLYFNGDVLARVDKY